MRDGRGGDRRGELAAWRQSYTEGLPALAGECPSEEALAALAVGEVTGEARLELADHVVACRRCAAAYRTLLDLHRAVPAPGTSGGRRRPRRLRWPVAGAVAAALAAALGLAVLEPPRLPEGEGGPRGAASAGRETDPPHGARLAEAPERLAWARTEPDATYRVVLYDSESVPLWESAPTAESSVELPPPLRKRLGAGTYYWRLRIEEGLGWRAAPLRRFEIGR